MEYLVKDDFSLQNGYKKVSVVSTTFQELKLKLTTTSLKAIWESSGVAYLCPFESFSVENGTLCRYGYTV